VPHLLGPGVTSNTSDNTICPGAETPAAGKQSSAAQRPGVRARVACHVQVQGDLTGLERAGSEASGPWIGEHQTWTP
jgi:hypothetical protein